MSIMLFFLAILSTSNLKSNENDDSQSLYPKSILIDLSTPNTWLSHKIEPEKEWVISADSEQTTDTDDEGPISNILDGNPSTIWRSKKNDQGNGGHDSRTNTNGPFTFTIDLKARKTFKAFSFTPRQTGDEGKFRLYEFYAAHSMVELNTETQSGKYLAKGQIDPDQTLSTLIILPYSATAQYIAVRSLDNSVSASLAEFALYKDPDSKEPTPTPMAIKIDEFREKVWNPLKINRTGWIATANSEQAPGDTEGPASYMIDGNKDTIWHSRYNSGHNDRPHDSDPFQATIDLGKETTFRAFSYMPRQKGENGQFQHYEFYAAQTSDDLNSKIANAEYIAKGDIFEPTSILSTLVIFPTTYTAQFIAIRSLDHDGYATCAEFNLYSEPQDKPKFHTQLEVNELNDPGWNPYKIDRSGWNVTANSERIPNSNNDGPVSFMVDGNKDTMWHSMYDNKGHDDRPNHSDPFQATIDLGNETTFEAFSYMPRQAGKNGQIKHFEFYTAKTREELDNLINESKYLAKGDIDPTSRLSTFIVFDGKVTAQYIALLSVSHDGYVTCAEFNLYSEIPNFYPDPPTPAPVPLSTNAIINEATDTFWPKLRIDRTGWKIRANSQENNRHTNGDGPASFIINGNPLEWWHTRYQDGRDDRPNPNYPYEFTIDLGKMESFSAFSYRPRIDTTGRFKHYQFYTANTTEELFTKIAEQYYIAAGDIDHNLDSSTFIIFKEQQIARYVALLSVRYNDNHATCAEFNLYTAPPLVQSDQSAMTNQEGLINLTCDEFTYENWQSNGKCVENSNADGGSFSNVIGSKAKITFYGTKAHLLVMKESDSGTAYIHIDNSTAFVDFKSYTNNKAKSIIFSSDELEYGEHTLEIECLSAKSIVFSSLYINPLPKENSYVLGYSNFKNTVGDWTYNSSTHVFSSVSDPASGLFEFYGTRFYLTGVRGRSVGNLKIYIDNNDNFITINKKQDSGIAQDNRPIKLYDSGVLDFKMHSVKIERSDTSISLLNLYYTWYPNSETPAPTQTPTETPTQTPTETPTPAETVPPTTIIADITYDDDNFTENDGERTRIEKEVKGDNEIITVVVKKSNFNGITNNDGGAIHLINCGLKTNGNIFEKCTSNEGGGGAIFIENSKDLKNDVYFYRLKFIGCSAEYGGGAYIYSNSLTNNVDIKSCTFKDNVATRSETDGGKFGGAAMYLFAARSFVRLCKFTNNDVRVVSDLESSSLMRILSLEETSLIFSECIFEINENMKFSLFYYGGNYATNLKLQSCSFYGKIKDDAYFIDGQSMSKNYPKMIVNSCRFSSKPNNAFNPNSHFAYIKLKDQIYESDKLEDSSDKNVKNMKSLIIFSALAMAVIIVLVISLFISIKKFISQNVHSDANEELEVTPQPNDL